MNHRAIINTTGRVAYVLGALLVLPMIIAFCFGESSWAAFAITIGVCVAIGTVAFFCFKPKDITIFSKEGFIIVAFAWILVSLVGALPFVISGAIPSYIDALFETASGFSTTGASILTSSRIDALYNTDKAILFWRSLTHWVGGMGVIVFIMALTNSTNDRGMHVLRAEMPGPTVDKIVPRAKNTAKILYLLYVGFTFSETLMLIFGGMPIFDSIVLSFGTAGTGGFAVQGDSIAGYSAYCQWVITAFMLLFGVNFNLYYLIILGKIRNAFSSRELWAYVGIVVVCATAITANVTGQLAYTQNFGDAIRHSVFQTASFLTTTGYTTIPSNFNVNTLPLLTKGVLFVLMFVGGCAGSTAGGLKVGRVILLICAVKKEVTRTLHPRNANVVKYEGKPISEDTLHSVTSYFGLYMVMILVVFLVLCCDSGTGLTVESNIVTAVSCFNNIGPSYGVASGGMYVYGNFSKIVLTLAMLFGRLEIYPLLLAFSPSTWIKK